MNFWINNQRLDRVILLQINGNYDKINLPSVEWFLTKFIKLKKYNFKSSKNMY